MTETFNALPLDPSELLTLAANDLRAVGDNPDYQVYMGDWHAPDGRVCSVCLAGAVMAGTLKVPKDAVCIPSFYRPRDDSLQFNPSDTDFFALVALDYARMGCWDIFIRTLNTARENVGLPATKGCASESEIHLPLKGFVGILEAHEVSELATELLLRARYWKEAEL